MNSGRCASPALKRIFCSAVFRSLVPVRLERNPMKSRGGSPAAVTDALLRRPLYQFSVPLLPKPRLYHYEELDIYNQREKFQLYGRLQKRHLFYVEKEGMFWVCENVNDLFSCHAFASRGSGSWIDVDYLSKAIGKLGTRTLYIAALTDYDPWGVFIAKQIRKKFESELFNFRNVHLEILTTLDLYDPQTLHDEKRYLLANHHDPKDPINKVVMKWVKAGGGINGEPYGIYSDHVNQELLMERVEQWIKGKWRNELITRMDVTDGEWKAAKRKMKPSE